MTFPPEFTLAVSFRGYIRISSSSALLLHVYLLFVLDLGADPQVPGPMAELEFWRERANVLSDLCEQLKLPVVNRILEVASQVDLDPMQNLNETIKELNLYHVEAMENMRFLGTVERHFRVSQNF